MSTNSSLVSGASVNGQGRGYRGRGAHARSAEVERAQRRPSSAKAFGEGEHVPGRPSQAVGRGDDEGVAGVDPVEGVVEPWAACAGSADAVVAVEVVTAHASYGEVGHLAIGALLVLAFAAEGCPANSDPWLRAYSALGGSSRHAESIAKLIEEMNAGNEAPRDAALPRQHRRDFARAAR